MRWLTFNSSSTCHLQNMEHNQPNQPYFCYPVAESAASLKTHAHISLMGVMLLTCHPFKFGSVVGGTGSGVEKVRDLKRQSESFGYLVFMLFLDHQTTKSIKQIIASQIVTQDICPRIMRSASLSAREKVLAFSGHCI